MKEHWMVEFSFDTVTDKWTANLYGYVGDGQTMAEACDDLFIKLNIAYVAEGKTFPMTKEYEK